jgi:hypothetical protein
MLYPTELQARQELTAAAAPILASCADRVLNEAAAFATSVLR